MDLVKQLPGKLRTSKVINLRGVFYATCRVLRWETITEMVLCNRKSILNCICTLKPLLRDHRNALNVLKSWWQRSPVSGVYHTWAISASTLKSGLDSIPLQQASRELLSERVLIFTVAQWTIRWTIIPWIGSILEWKFHCIMDSIMHSIINRLRNMESIDDWRWSFQFDQFASRYKHESAPRVDILNLPFIELLPTVLSGS